MLKPYVKKPEERTEFGTHTWEDNIKMDPERQCVTVWRGQDAVAASCGATLVTGQATGSLLKTGRRLNGAAVPAVCLHHSQLSAILTLFLGFYVARFQDVSLPKFCSHFLPRTS
jgi:hypothetical protein